MTRLRRLGSLLLLAGGLAYGQPALAGKPGGRPPSQQEVEEARARLQGALEIKALQQYGAGGPKLRAFVEARASLGHKQGPLRLVGKPGDSLAIDAASGKLLVLGPKGASRPALLDDLRRHGLSSQEQVHALLDHEVSSAQAKLGAEIKLPLTAFEARRALEGSRDLGLLGELHHYVLAPRGLAPREGIPLAQGKHDSIVVHYDASAWSNRVLIGYRGADGVLHPKIDAHDDAASKLDEATYHQLGLKLEGDAEARAAAALTQAAQLAGVHAASLPELRTALKRQVEEARELEGLLNVEKKIDALPPVAIQLMLDHAQKKDHYHVAHVALSRQANETLELYGFLLSHKVYESKVEVVAGDGTRRKATLADLHRHGLPTRAAFESKLRSLGAASGQGFEDRLALAALLRTGALVHDAELQLLERYRSTLGLPPVHLAGDDKHGIMMAERGTLKVHDASASAWVQPLDVDMEHFSQHGIGSVAQLKAHITRALVKASGVRGDATDPKVLAEAKRAIGLRIGQVTRLMKHVHGTTDLELLHRHHENGDAKFGEFAYHGNNKALTQVVLAQDSQGALVWDEGQLRTVSTEDLRTHSLRRIGTGKIGWFLTGTTTSDTTQRASFSPTTYHDLARFGLADERAFDQLVAEQLAKAAGVPAGTRSLASLRRMLEQQIADAPTLYRYLEGHHPDAELVLKVYRSVPHPEKTTKAAAIPLGKIGRDTLYLGSTEYDFRYDVFLNDKQATLADLRRFGLGTIEAFDGAVHHVMTNLAPEDYE